MRVYVGDSITALGHTFEVAKIIYQDCYQGNYDVEFLDPRGGYHHWKSEFDGGRIIPNGGEE
jgi:hypothetical protein